MRTIAPGVTAFGNAGTPTPDPLAISQRDFWKRFTVAEREALQNILATGTQTQKNKLGAFRDYVWLGVNVELDDDHMIASVTLMEQANVIGNDRATEILT